jgi:hypothetical protein
MAYSCAEVLPGRKCAVVGTVVMETRGLQVLAYVLLVAVIAFVSVGGV